MAPYAQMGSGCLSRGLLLLCALLVHEFCRAGATAESFGQEARTTPAARTTPVTAHPHTEVIYTNLTQRCWESFEQLMQNVSGSQLCEWKVISRPYSSLRQCLEEWAESLNYGYPNALAETYIFQSHHRYFHNCSAGSQVYLDPPEDVLLAMIIAPICLIPFLVTLVIWRSKDGKAQP
uniref:Receptor activity modifying protein 2 n=1 Tax=Coturnix japonica TaxID=93934 RepID=A0A8C2T0D7_COTJA